MPIQEIVRSAGVPVPAAHRRAAARRCRRRRRRTPPTIEKVRDNLFMIKGGGGNTAAFVTRQGVVLVDTKLANWGQAIMDQVRSVTDKPVTTIINTHTHGDHTGSNEFFPASVEVVAHENTKTNMEKMKQFEGEKAQFLPDRTYKDRLTLFSGPTASTSTTSAPVTPTATRSSSFPRCA